MNDDGDDGGGLWLMRDQQDARGGVVRGVVVNEMNGKTDVNVGPDQGSDDGGAVRWTWSVCQVKKGPK